MRKRSLTRTWSAEAQALKLAKIARRSVVASAFGVNMMGRSVARGPFGGIALAVDCDTQRFSLECLVQPLVLSSRGLDVSGVDVTERSSGAVGAQGLHKQRFPVMQGWARDGC